MPTNLLIPKGSGGGGGGATPLTPTAVKSANYNATAGQLVPVDISAGSFTITLPTAPADQTQVCVEVIKHVQTITSNTVAPFYATIACGGSDTLIRASGPTSAIFGRGSVVLQYQSSTAIWYAPGMGDFLPNNWDFGYDQIVASVNVTATTDATSNTIISCAAHVFDGGDVYVDFTCAQVVQAAGDGFVVVNLWEGATEIGDIVVMGQPTSMFAAQVGKFRFTPSAGSHTYLIKAYKSSNSGTSTITAGAGGVATIVPAFVRFTKA